MRGATSSRVAAFQDSLAQRARKRHPPKPSAESTPQVKQPELVLERAFSAGVAGGVNS